MIEILILFFFLLLFLVFPFYCSIYLYLYLGTTHQCGILAAAGLIGLNNLSQIATDNSNAKLLAIGLNTINGITVKDEPESNLIYLNCEIVTATTLVIELEKKGVLCFALGKKRNNFL